MPRIHSKRYLAYCEGCKIYFMQQPSNWIMRQMWLHRFDVFLDTKLCKGCKEKEKKRMMPNDKQQRFES